MIGAGCVVDPEVLIAELDDLEARGIDTSVVVLSGNAHLIMPWHIAIDQASERRLGKLQIGTTRRGIGPCYADKASRIGIRVQDVLDPKILRQKIEVALAEKNVWLERVYEVDGFDLDEVAARYEGYAQAAAPDRRRRLAARRRGAHATARTCSSRAPRRRCSTSTTAPTRSSPRRTRSPRAPRPGSGSARPGSTACSASPRPTSPASAKGRSRPRSKGPDQERLRELGGEFGTVTGRARRCGWLDLVALRYAVRVNGMTSLALTKLDVLSDFAELPVCVALPAPRRLRDARTSPPTRATSTTPRPVWETLPGWQEPLDGADRRDELPDAARGYVEFVERELGIPVELVGVGAARERVLV